MMMNSSNLRGERKRSRAKMRIASRPLLLGLAVVMIFGTAVYFRLWFIDYRISADDTELLRREFDLAHREAVEESAEWRLRFDAEREKAKECLRADSGIDQSSIQVMVRVSMEDQIKDLEARIETQAMGMQMAKMVELLNSGGGIGGFGFLELLLSPQMKESLGKQAKDKPSVHERLEMLQKETIDLLKRLESLKQEHETEKLKCTA